MRVDRRSTLAIIFTAGLASLHAATLEEGFRTPPMSARPSTYFLLLNGYLNRSYVEKELAEFKDAGFGGICLFDMGARGDAKSTPPAGPAFMSPQSVEDLAHVIRVAGRLNMDVSLAVTSSWDLGGSWVQPEDGSMTLTTSRLEITGPSDFDAVLPLANSKQAFYRDVAVLAIPNAQRVPGYEFVYELPVERLGDVDRVVLYNTNSEDAEKYGPNQLFAREFSVSVSTTGVDAKSFQEVVRGTLAPREGAQEFRFGKRPAKYIRLVIHNGYNTGYDRVELGEFEVYSPGGVNVLLAHSSNQATDGPRLVRFSSELGSLNNWSANNINDGRKNGARGSWSSAEQPPLLIPDSRAIVDLSKAMDASGRLRWKVPPGKWTVLRYTSINTGERLKVPSPNSDGLATDHLSASATRRCLEYVVNHLKGVLPSFAGTALKNLYLPSYEVQGRIWTPDFLQQFRKLRGYDLTPFLPALSGGIVNNEEATSRVRYDFDKTLGQLLVNNFYRTAADVAHEAGVGVESEAGGPGPPIHRVPVDALQALGAVDVVRGEFWPYRPDVRSMWVIKETASAAHIYGKQLVNMESFTSNFHWQEGPAFLKAAADRAFSEGMNHVVWHTASHQPPEAGKPGWVYGAGTHIGPTRVWWPMAKPFVEYLGRSSFLLQQGLFAADVLYYYGDQGYNFVLAKHVDPSLGPGYDYDVTNEEVLLHRLSVVNGKLHLPDGMHYEILALPDRTDIDLPVLEQIAKMVMAGATVVGPKPDRATGYLGYPGRDQSVRELGDKVWGGCDGKSVKDHLYGKGRVVCGLTLREVLLARGVSPDFSYRGKQSDADIDFVHRTTANEEIYFVHNKKARFEEIDATFRVQGGIPEFWLPHSGAVLPALLYTSGAGGLTLPLQLAPEGSLFVVFRKGRERQHVLSLRRGSLRPDATDRAGSIFPEVSWTGDEQLTAFEPGTYTLELSNGQPETFRVAPLPSPIRIENPWEVRFEAGRGAPQEVQFPRLISWTESENPGVRYFSGIAEYQNRFEIPEGALDAGRRVFLDLGSLWAVADVAVNDKAFGVVWKAPYRVDVTAALHRGRNTIRVRVANDWVNRLIGDARDPGGEKFTRTNIKGAGQDWARVNPVPSGLLGPVQLRFGATLRTRAAQ
jgi:hypothetical protein